MTLQERENIIRQIKTIAESLLAKNIIHTDLGCKGKNFIYSSDGWLKLIDYGGCVFQNEIEKNKQSYIDSHIFIHLFVIGRLKWGNAYYLLKILKKIGVRREYQLIYNEVTAYLKQQAKHHTVSTNFLIRFSNKNFSFFFKRKLFQLIMCFIPFCSWRKKIRNYLFRTFLYKK
ncbi:MAG: hypothetical protein LBJ67_04455 [Planctomycetaceae bacterium]|nr:hypothetical protein [Planctomycetaceae bacterium]